MNLLLSSPEINPKNFSNLTIFVVNSLRLGISKTYKACRLLNLKWRFKIFILLSLLDFDDDYTLCTQMYFYRLCAGQYSVAIKIVDGTYDLVYEHVLVRRIQTKLEKVYRLGCQM